MSGFQDIVIAWDGAEYTIKSHRVMGLLSQIEEVITFAELEGYTRRGTIPLVKLSMAYGRILRYAGCSIHDEDVYIQMFVDDDIDQNHIVIAVTKIMALMLPPDKRQGLISALETGVTTEEKEGDDPGNSLPAVAASSRKPIKPRSEKKAS